MVPTDLRYTKDHEWLDLLGDRGKVGITDYAQQQLGDVAVIPGFLHASLARSFDDFVGAGDQGRWNVQPERLRGC